MDERRILRRVAYASNHWWISLLLGVLFIIAGIWILRTPVEGYMAIKMLFVILFLANGFAEIFVGFVMRKESSGWGWIAAGGMIDIVIALLLLTDPLLSLTILSFFIGFALLFRSIMAIGLALDIRHNRIRRWQLLLCIGIAGMVFSFIILRNTVIAGLTFVFWTGLAFITIGLFRTMLAFRLRRIHEEILNVMEEDN